jgi:hypothetical protein
MMKAALLTLAILTSATLGGCTAAGETEPGQSDDMLRPSEDGNGAPAPESRGRTSPLDFADTGAVSRKNAYWLARLAHLAYRGPDQIRDTLKTWEFRGPLFIFENDRTHMQAFYVDLRDSGVVVFRGTEPSSFSDWARDAMIRIQSTAYGKAHEGFHEGLVSLWRDGVDGLRVVGNVPAGQGLGAFLRQRHSLSNGDHRPLLIAGHSLGGAAAALAYVLSQYEGCAPDRFTQTCAREHGALDVVGVYTFGAPRIGGDAIARLAGSNGASSRRRTYRFVYGNDPIPALPPAVFYRHPLVGDDEHALVMMLGANHDQVPHSYPDHDLVRYIDALGAQLGQ